MSALAAAREKWGEPLPDWVETLALACDRSSQAKVAKELDRSSALVSQVLSRKYTGSMDRVEELVRGVFLDSRVACPSLGEIPVNACQNWRDKAQKFVMASPLRLRMYRACNGCPRNQKEVSE